MELCTSRTGVNFLADFFVLLFFLPILPLPELDLLNKGSKENCSVGVFGVTGLRMLFLDALGVPILE